jgi:hypothetical protein
VSSNTENSVAGMTGWKPSGAPVTRATVPPQPGGAVRPPSAPRERKPALAALALLLIAAGVLASVYLQTQAGNRIGVIELSRRVPQGQQVTAADITEAMVARDSSINYVNWSERSLLGKYTTQTDLVAGTLLVGQMLTTAPAANSDTTTIPVTLKTGQFPPSIGVGDKVNAYYVGPASNNPLNGTSTSSSSSSAVDVSVLLSASVKLEELPTVSGGGLGGSAGSNGVFSVSVPKTDVSALLSASAEGDLVFTSGAGS